MAFRIVILKLIFLFCLTYSLCLWPLPGHFHEAYGSSAPYEGVYEVRFIGAAPSISIDRLVLLSSETGTQAAWFANHFDSDNPPGPEPFQLGLLRYTRAFLFNGVKVEGESLSKTSAIHERRAQFSMSGREGKLRGTLSIDRGNFRFGAKRIIAPSELKSDEPCPEPAPEFLGSYCVRIEDSRSIHGDGEKYCYSEKATQLVITQGREGKQGFLESRDFPTQTFQSVLREDSEGQPVYSLTGFVSGGSLVRWTLSWDPISKIWVGTTLSTLHPGVSIVTLFPNS